MNIGSYGIASKFHHCDVYGTDDTVERGGGQMSGGTDVLWERLSGLNNRGKGRFSGGRPSNVLLSIAPARVCFGGGRG